jgi:hypothetical protein
MNDMNLWSMNAIRWCTTDEMHSDGWMWTLRWKLGLRVASVPKFFCNWMMWIFVNECQAIGWISMDEMCSDGWTGHIGWNLS